MNNRDIKKIAIYGDSISTTSHGDGGYEGILKKSLCLDHIYNYAVSGSGLSLHTPNSMASIVQGDNIPEDVQLILIWHGTNDWYWGTELGSPMDKEANTFWGAISFVLHRLRSKLPTAKIAWATPIYRKEAPEGSNTSGNAYQSQNAVGHTLLDYYEALEKASKIFGFYLLDMRRLSNIHGENAHLYLEDEAHPNRAGYELIHEVLYKEIKRL